MPHYPKPAEGSWTEHYPQLGTGPVSYEDSISPEHYELERKAIFERMWLNVGRVEQVAEPGSSFTKEIHAAGTSIIVARANDPELREYHAWRDGRVPVQIDVWEGFIFVNLDAANTVPLRDYL